MLLDRLVVEHVQTPATASQTGRSSHALSKESLLYRFNLFSLVGLVYIAAFVREYFWIVQNNLIAWTLTIAVSIGLSVVFLRMKTETTPRPPAVFWIVVGLPLFLVFFLRFGYPDLSFDVLNYHIFHSERALRGLLHIPGDFAPAYFPFFNNPVADVITGVFRHLLGFRLGTIVNYLVLMWTGAILFRFFQRDIKHPVLRSVAVLLVLFSEQLLFEINNYMIDLLALPLLMQATYLALVNHESDRGTQNKRLLVIALLLGASTALKLTNLVFVIPITLLVSLDVLADRRGELWRAASLIPATAVAFFLPMIPHAAYLYWTKGNPVFPLYNKLFQSAYWVNENPFDGRWGPVGAIDTLIWPFKILTQHDRLTELNVYSGRISIGLIAALVLLLCVRDRRARTISFLTITSAFLWSLVTGYSRYGLFLEILGGICLVILGTSIARTISHELFARVLAFSIWTILVAQVALAGAYILQVEWGGRGIGPAHPRPYRPELAQVFRDRSLTRYMTPDELKLFDHVGVWVESSYKVSALTAVLKPDIPYLNVFADAFVSTPAAMQKFKTELDADREKPMISLTFREDLSTAIQNLQKRGFAIKKSTPLDLPYYSFNRRLPLMVLEVFPDPTARKKGMFNAELTVQLGVSTLTVGQASTVHVKVRNAGDKVWLAKDALDETRHVTLGNKWLDPSGHIVINDDGRTLLPKDLAPGEEVELDLKIRAPKTPGNYTLMLDLVQEHVAWFFEKGSTPAELSVLVER